MIASPRPIPTEVGQRREKQRFNLAMDAIKLFHGEVSEDLLMKEKQFEGLRTKLLKAPPTFTAELEACEGPDRPRVLAALGKAYDELGELTGKIGDQPRRWRCIARPGGASSRWRPNRGRMRDEARRGAEPESPPAWLQRIDRGHGRCAGIARGGAAPGGGGRNTGRRSRTGLGVWEPRTIGRLRSVRERATGRGPGRVRQRPGDPAEAGRRQPRRYTVPA